MNVRMMPPQGPMGQPMPMGGAPAPMGGPPPMPMGGPMPVPPMQPTAGQQNKKGLGSTFGGNAQGRGQFKNFMSAKKQTSALVPQMQPSMQPMGSAPPMAQPTAAPQPMLPGPAPQMMGAMRPMGNAQVSMPIQAGRPMRGSQGGLGSAPVQLNMGGVVQMAPTDGQLGLFVGGQRQDSVPGVYQKMLRAGLPRDEAFGEIESLRNSAMHVADDLGKFLETPHSDFGHSHEDFKAANFANGGEVEIPRETEIGGQPHMLAYINPEEEDLLQDYRGDAPVGTGPGGVPAYIIHTGWSNSAFNPSNWGGGSSSSSSSSSSGGGGYEDAAYGGSKADFYTGGGFNVNDDDDNDDDDNTSTTVTTTVPTYTDTSSLTGISDASGFDYTGGDTGTTTTNYDSGYEDAAYDGSQAGFYNDGGFGTDTDSESDDSDTVTVVTGSSGYPSLDATAGSYTGDEFGTGNIFTEETPGGSTVDFGTGTNTETETTFPDTPPPSVYVPPPTYYDMFGGEHATQEAANAADKAYTDSQQQAIDIASQSDGQAGYTFGGMEYEGPDFDFDQGQQQSEASNNTAKLMNDYSTISDDYSTFQGNDLSTGDGNTIGYATGGSKAGYAAVVNPVTGGIDIYTPGSESIEASFAADELTAALNYLTDGDVDLSNLDAPADLLAGSVTGTETGDVGLESGVDAIDDIIERLDTEGLDSFGYDGTDAERLEAMTEGSFSGDLTGIPDDALDFVDIGKTDAEKVQDLVNMGVDRSLAEAQIASGGEIGEPAGIDAYDFGPTDALTSSQFDLTGGEESVGEDYTPTSAELAAQLEAAGLTNVTSGPLSVEEQADISGGSYAFGPDRADEIRSSDLDLLAADALASGEYDDTILGQGEGGLGSDADTAGIEDVAGSFENLLNTQPVDQSQMDVIANTIRELEGFGGDTYFDVNAERAGYGSDTKTDPVTGEVTKIEPGMTVTKEEAEADLNRRLTQDTTLSDGTVQKGFIPSVVDAVGADTFYAMSPTTQAALVSIAYNYGANWADKLPTLANAAKTGDTDLIADAIEDRSVDNDGINATRRLREAQMVRSGVPLGGDTDIYADDDVALSGTATGKGTGVGGADTEIVTEVTGDTGQTATQAYLSAMTKLDNPETMTMMEQQALYGARGQTPNAAETAYLNSLLRDAKHKEDGPAGADGEPIYKAGDYVVQQTGAEQFGDLIVKGIDFFLNPLTILGDKYSLENMNEAYVQEQLDAYKNGGTFVYDGAGTVVGIADANYDADGDGENDSVVLIGDDGEYTVTGGRIDVDDVNNSNQYSDTDEDIDDIDIVDSNTTYTNTEDGVVEQRVGGDEEQTGGDDPIDPCPEGFMLDPVLGECVPIDEVDTETGPPSLGDVIRPDTGSGTSTSTPTPASGDPMIIRGPKQFNVGGAVTPNIDRFMQSLGA